MRRSTKEIKGELRNRIIERKAKEMAVAIDVMDSAGIKGGEQIKKALSEVFRMPISPLSDKDIERVGLSLWKHNIFISSENLVTWMRDIVGCVMSNSRLKGALMEPFERLLEVDDKGQADQVIDETFFKKFRDEAINNVMEAKGCSREEARISLYIHVK